MRSFKGFLFSIVLAVGLVTAGCASANIPQTGVTAQKNIAPVQVQSNSSQSGGLVIKMDPQNSEARYRVREQLANVSLPTDAIGRTKQISGSVMIKPDGSIDPANSKFVVDLSTLQSDRSMRDNFLRRSVLQTTQYPDATFVPKQVSGLSWPLPKSGQVSFKLTGDMTIRDVTKSITWDVTGTVQNGQASGLAKTSFKFEDFNLNQPRVPVVLSIVDNITLEVDVALTNVN